MTDRMRSAIILAVLPAAMIGAIAYARAQSPAVSSTAGALRQIAYLKASNPVEDAHFGCGGTLTGHAGNSSAVSGDGNTLAVGAPHENSAAKGINGNQNDHSLYSSGAVYVFTRKGDSVAQQAYLPAIAEGMGVTFRHFVKNFFGNVTGSSVRRVSPS